MQIVASFCALLQLDHRPARRVPTIPSHTAARGAGLSAWQVSQVDTGLRCQPGASLLCLVIKNKHHDASYFIMKMHKANKTEDDMHYDDRQDAGKRLADAVQAVVSSRRDVIIFALPRGGIVPAAEVAKTLGVPVGVVLVRKIGHPGNPEYAIGAVAEGADAVYDDAEVMGMPQEWLETAEEEAHSLNKRRSELYYQHDSPPAIKGKTVILVDDGIATGLTMLAAIHAVRAQRPKQVIVAVPVAPRESLAELRHAADQVIVLDVSDNPSAVGTHYISFPQVQDAQVIQYLQEANHR